MGTSVNSAMNLSSKEFSLPRARLLTLIVLIGVAAAIALANLSSQPVTIDFLEEIVLKGKAAERPYGWPSAWYWRSRSATLAPRWPVSRYSLFNLCVDLAMWLAMLASTAGAIEWLLRRYRPQLRWRPRVRTVIVQLLVTAIIVLTNLSFDMTAGLGRWQEFSYGWPLLWYWHVDFTGMNGVYQEWDYSATALAGNATIWLTMLAATAYACEWLVCRYWPAFRWSLRTMLAGVAVTAGICAWYVVARNRAAEQDAIAASIGIDDLVYYEHCGPKWLTVVGADRFRRHVVGVWLDIQYTKDKSAEHIKLSKRLTQLPSLRFLGIQADTHPRWPRGFTHDLATMLTEMQQLRMLDFECQPTFPYSHSTLETVQQFLAAICKLVRLKRLRLSIWAENIDDLACLSHLTNLKTLALNIQPINGRANADVNHSELPVLSRLPALPHLEELDLHESSVCDDDLGQLAGFAGLKRIDLCSTLVTDAGLAKLSRLESLEELAIDERIATAAVFEALITFNRLKKIHIAPTQHDTESFAAVALDDGNDFAVLPRELSRVRRALRDLRRRHPGIVIDGNYDEFATRVDLEAFWDGDYGSMDVLMHRWLCKP